MTHMNMNRWTILIAMRMAIAMTDRYARVCIHSSIDLYIHDHPSSVHK